MIRISNQFLLNSKIIFDQGSLSLLSKIKGHKALVISDGILEKLGYLKQVTDYLKEAGIESVTFTDVKPDPDTKVIAAGMQLYLQTLPDVMVAIGGGSAIDAAKGIFYTAQQMSAEPIKKPYFVAVPTTSGTGSEVTDFSVITAEDQKVVIVDEMLAPDLAILDSDCVSSVPAKVVVDAGLDVLTHATEAYVSKNANDFTDALAEKAIKLIFEYLPQVYQDIHNDNARNHVHNASCLAGIAFNNAGLGIIHSLAHALGGRFHIAHGRCNALLIEHVIQYNAELCGSANNQAAEKYAKLAEILQLPARTTREGVVNYLDAIAKLKKSLKVETSFKALISDEASYCQAIGEMTEGAMLDRCTPTNPIAPTAEALATIYKKAF
ncbi:alcohol dehydrogenase class IV [Enterococcus sp. PF1-24]|uniref:1-propanol dehydrogenase PduQ n=1 Tax=unclassified Enterococcus TaxID=2608891 RepID=UPI002476B343|nr:MULTISPECIES: 1-propanol dehydrogenase PduQ [unclassified Enterococcus]MDH6364081.1 alcohol dehydrogenase class IV [Enterococcus sp. PFB1-1]MDH6401182.1 alcohol dehydrogenase class IV [Enterococcus sp. PF1-24]